MSAAEEPKRPDRLDPDVLRAQGWTVIDRRPKTREEAERLVKEFEEHWAALREGQEVDVVALIREVRQQAVDDSDRMFP